MGRKQKEKNGAREGVWQYDGSLLASWKGTSICCGHLGRHLARIRANYWKSVKNRLRFQWRYNGA